MTMHLISLNLVHPVDSGVDESERQLLGFCKAKAHKVIQEYKSALRLSPPLSLSANGKAGQLQGKG